MQNFIQKYEFFMQIYLKRVTKSED